MRSRSVFTASLVVFATLLAGCAAEPQSPDPDPTGSSEPTASPSVEPTQQAPDPSPSTSLHAALASTPVNTNSTTYFAFTDLSAYGEPDLDSWLQATLEPGLLSISGVGLDNFAQFARVVPELLPHPGAEDATATTMGVPPYVTTRMTAVPNLESVFSDISGERSAFADGTLLVRRDDLAVDLNDKEFPASFLARLNVIWFDDGTMITGTARAGVEQWADLQSGTLAEHYAGLSECLGESFGALIVSADYARTAGDVGVAVGGERDDALVQTLCVRTTDASTEVAAVESRIADGVDQRSGTPLSELLPDAVVDSVDGEWLRVRTPVPNASTLVQMLYSGELSVITG